MKTTLKEIKSANATDITYLSTKELYALYEKEKGFNDVAYSMGAYGCSGAVVQGRTSGKLYKITSRTNALFICS